MNEKLIKAPEVVGANGINISEMPPKIPEPSATGGEKIAILKHSINLPIPGHETQPTGIDLAIRNISEQTIARTLFETIFYDQEGNLFDKVLHTEVQLLPGTSRAIHIKPLVTDITIKSYLVRVMRTTTTDFEKLQVIRIYDVRTTKSGEEEIWGIVKNISSVKTSAAVIASYSDSDKHIIGIRVFAIKDIEPNSISKFHLLFKPQDSEIVDTFDVSVAELTETY